MHDCKQPQQTVNTKSFSPDETFVEHEFQNETHDNAEGRPQEECGVFGIYAPGVDVARRTFFGIFALQHRGQESAGIAVTDGTHIKVHTDMGLVSQIFDEQTLSTLPGDIAVGHTRYSTTGSSKACNAQPILTESSEGIMAVAHNGNLVNAPQVREELESQGVQFATTMDTEAIAKTIELHKDLPLEEALLETMRRIQGAYSLVLMTRDTLIAMRDTNGVRPLCIGKLRGSASTQDGESQDNGEGWVVASETCALNVVGAEYVREVEPGEIVFINADGIESVHLKDKPSTPKIVPRCASSSSSIWLARLAVAGTQRASRAPSHGRNAGQTGAGRSRCRDRCARFGLARRHRLRQRQRHSLIRKA
jgi:amidophosphoribosyltransferase